MIQLLNISAQVGALFFYIFLGFIGRNKKILNSEGDKVISDIIFYFTMPALTITSMNFEVSSKQLTNAWLILAASLLLVILSYLITTLTASYLSLPPKENYAFCFTSTFGNVTYLGFPVAYILFGRLGVFYAAIYSLGHNFLFWILGVRLMQGHKHSGLDWRKVFNINVVAIIIGFTLALLHLQIPEVVFNPMNTLGQATIPLALILVGSMLAKSDIRLLTSKKILYLIIFVKLIFFPFLTLVALLFFSGWDNITRILIVMQTAMPVASIAPAVARKYDGDFKLVSEGVVVTTLFSLLTIPIWVWCLKFHIFT
ncbi:MAG: malate permease [Clostridia bacterium]|nr:malate permease [Clostridia bacterium]